MTKCFIAFFCSDRKGFGLYYTQLPSEIANLLLSMLQKETEILYDDSCFSSTKSQKKVEGPPPPTPRKHIPQKINDYDIRIDKNVNGKTWKIDFPVWGTVLNCFLVFGESQIALDTKITRAEDRYRGEDKTYRN